MSQQVLKSPIFAEIYQSLSLSLPLIVSNLVQSSSGFVATLMVARLGRDYLAAGALGFAIYIVLLVFLFGMFAAVGILVSQSYGANDIEGVRLSVVQGFLMAIILSVPAFILMRVLPRILSLADQNHHVIVLATQYLDALSWCFLPLSFLVIMEQFLIGISRTRLVLGISLLQVPFEILSTYAFVFGKFGLPVYGIAGLGYGFAAVFVVAAIFIALFIGFSKYSRDYHIFSRCWHINVKFFKELFRIGWPISVTNTIEVALMSVITFLMGHFGSSQLAAYQIARQFWILGMMIVFSIAQAATVRVGQAVGRGDKSTITLSAYVNMGIGFVLVVGFSLMYFIDPQQLIGIDIDPGNPYRVQLMHYAILFLSVAGIAQLLDNFRFIAVGALRGLKDTRFSMYVSFVVFWLIALPAAYILAFVLHLEGVGLWLGLVTGVACGAIILLLRFRWLVEHIDISTLLIKSD